MPDLMDNEIASTIDAADAQARYDSAARNLVAQKSILVRALQARCLPGKTRTL